MEVSFEWDEQKNWENQIKHGIPFEAAQYAFADPHRLILRVLDIRPRKKNVSIALAELKAVS
jgi:uncharacterized DUF497 family protein